VERICENLNFATIQIVLLAVVLEFVSSVTLLHLPSIGNSNSSTATSKPPPRDLPSVVRTMNRDDDSDGGRHDDYDSTTSQSDVKTPPPTESSPLLPVIQVTAQPTFLNASSRVTALSINDSSVQSLPTTSNDSDLSVTIGEGYVQTRIENQIQESSKKKLSMCASCFFLFCLLEILYWSSWLIQSFEQCLMCVSLMCIGIIIVMC
jgi:hypothetical protein